jgi:hypothetical protein
MSISENGEDTRHIAYCKIHPGIGIARLGNSADEFFIGPEAPGRMGLVG